MTLAMLDRQFKCHGVAWRTGDERLGLHGFCAYRPLIEPNLTRDLMDTFGRLILRGPFVGRISGKRTANNVIDGNVSQIGLQITPQSTSLWLLRKLDAMAKKHIGPTQAKPGIKAWITSQPSKLRTDLRAALGNTRQAFNPSNNRDLLWWHRVGLNVAKFFPDGQRQHGSSVMELLARELGAVGDNEIRSVANTLWQARTIAKTLGSATAAKTWARKRNGKDQPLSAYHVFAVANVEASEQPELLEKCLEESWSVRQLRREVQNRFGTKRSRGGRKAAPRKVPSPKIALQDIQRQTRQWLADHKAWFAGPKAALRNVSKREQTMELQKELVPAWNALVEMQVAVETGLVRLRELETRVEEKLGRETDR